MTARAVDSIHLMATSDLTRFAEVVHPRGVNREAKDEPPATRGEGPAAFLATALWLQTAFSELAWDVHDVVSRGDVVVVHVTMSGRQTGTFVGYGPDGRPVAAFPPTGRTFAVTQTHWLRMADGMVIEHWANRDDLGMARQLGWAPPSPGYLVRMWWALRRARAAGQTKSDPPSTLTVAPVT